MADLGHPAKDSARAFGILFAHMFLSSGRTGTNMTGGRPVQVVPLSRPGRAARRQPIGYAGLISRTHWPADVADCAHGSAAHGTAHQADFARHEDTAAEQMRTDLLPRLPLGDA